MRRARRGGLRRARWTRRTRRDAVPQVHRQGSVRRIEYPLEFIVVGVHAPTPASRAADITFRSADMTAMSRSAPSVTYEASYALMRWRKPQDPLQESGRFDTMDGQAGSHNRLLDSLLRERSVVVPRVCAVRWRPRAGPGPIPLLDELEDLEHRHVEGDDHAADDPA